ncbi:Abi family protein [Stakelama flava]|uniref:Abi family protein n=1 Tax=Stakelama flava TaxID=2860338 RepID=UPI001FEB1631|nr:Abi family protein [Stakelama flava]
MIGHSATRSHGRSAFGLPEAVLVSLLKHLSTVRNSCAHHARLWNRGFLLRMKLPMKPADLVATLELPAGKTPAYLYNTLVLIRYLLMQIDPASNWQSILKAHLATHPTGNLAAMGFPARWNQRPLWL